MSPIPQSPIRELTQAVKEEARRLGFLLVGITTPEPLPHLDVYARWLENGHHAGMAWMATDRALERRADPPTILPACKSILSLGIPYAVPTGLEASSIEPEAQIAAYAWGTDYHDVLPDRLRAIVAFIEKAAGKPVQNRWYTDTGPILEREIAQRAGLGWIGKNTCLIHPQMGSYFLLAEILLEIELLVDDPIRIDHCGTCTRCIDHCPTSCITPDRTIDTNRCLSYLTIEHKGIIAETLRPKLGGWIFGCDMCQQVCPWNQKFAVPQHEAVFAPRPGIPPASLAAELALSPQEFNRKFKASPIKRAKRRGYLRNVAIASGNSQNPATSSALIQALDDIEPLIRGHAAWALGRIGGEEAREALRRARKIETDPDVLAEIAAALQQIR